MIAMILAAGRGERLRPLTDTVPKALVEVDGQSLLERHLRNLQRAGIENVVINLGWLGKKVIERVGDGSGYGLNIAYSDEGDNVLETGGGIHKALPLLGADPFIVLNTDTLTDAPISDCVLCDSATAKLLVAPTPVWRDRGDFDLIEGLIRNSESPELTYCGVSMYRPEFFDGCQPGRFSVVPMWRRAADAGQLQGSLYEGPWADIGTPERLAELAGRSAGLIGDYKT